MAIRILLFSLFVCIATFSKGQGHLMDEIRLSDAGPQRIYDVLETITKKKGFYFSYNSDVVPYDSVITTVRYSGRLIDFLINTLGEAYEFRESPGYVIIRYAPRRMAVALHIEKHRFGPLVIEGQLNDLLTDEAVPFASIYERHVLVSTLSDRAGKFRLSVKRPGETLWLTVSKENYRDTTLALIAPVSVGAKDSKIREWFYPENAMGSGLESSAIGRFFAGSRQRIQALNLGGFLAYNPFQISLTPGLSSQGMLGGQLVNRFSLNVLGGRTAGVDGIEVAGIFNVNQADVRHLQAAGLLNIVGGNVSGFQVAGAGNNVENKVTGTQVGGLFNHAEYVRGVQLAGIINVAGKVDGVQITSFINVADSSDYPIGLINLVKQGRKSLAVGMEEAGFANLAFRSGGRVLYGLLGIGRYVNTHPLPYGFEGGLGVRLLQHNAFALDAELLSRVSIDFRGNMGKRHMFRLLPSFLLSRHFALMAGPTAGYEKKWQIGIYGAVVVPLSR